MAVVLVVDVQVLVLDGLVDMHVLVPLAGEQRNARGHHYCRHAFTQREALAEERDGEQRTGERRRGEQD